MKLDCLFSLLAAGAVLTPAAFAMGVDPQQAAAAKAPDCKVTDFRIAAADEVDLYCNPRLSGPVSGTIRLSEVDNQGQQHTSVDGTFFWLQNDMHWIQVALQQPLKPNTKYQITGTTAKGTIPFDVFSFDTKPTATVLIKEHSDLPNHRCPEGEWLVVLQSKIALAPTSLAAAQLDLSDGSSQKVKLQPVSPDVSDRLVIGRAEGCSPYSIGIREAKSFTLEKVENILATEVKGKGTYKTGKAPADKTSSAYYAQFDAQAGQGQKPGYTIVGTLDPKLQYWGGGFYFTPNADVDLGYGSLDNTKVTDMIKAGGGLTRYFPSWSTEFEPSLQFETDRHGAHRNLIFDGKAQYFGRGWRQTIAEKTYEKFAAQVLKGGPDVPKTVDEVKLVPWGWQLELFGGVETGEAFTNDSVKSSDKKTSVVLPSYDIARVRPNASITGEYKWASLNLNVTPRYLFPYENVTREFTKLTSPTSTTTFQQIYVTRLNGWRTLGVATFLLNLDRVGHACWSVTYKAGSEPPNFNHVNMVETGLLLKY
jgi:hypothetical protein